MPIPILPILGAIGAVVLTAVGVRVAETRGAGEEVERRVQEDLEAYKRSLKCYMLRTVRDVLVTAMFYSLMWLLPYWVLPHVFFLCAFLYALYTFLARLPLLLVNLPMILMLVWKSVSNMSISDAVYDIARLRASKGVRRAIAYRVENLDLVSWALHGVFGRTRSEIENAIMVESAWSIRVETAKFKNSLMKYGAAIIVFLGGLYFARGLMWSSEYNWLADLWGWIRNI